METGGSPAALSANQQACDFGQTKKKGEQDGHLIEQDGRRKSRRTAGASPSRPLSQG